MLQNYRRYRRYTGTLQNSKGYSRYTITLQNSRCYSIVTKPNKLSPSRPPLASQLYQPRSTLISIQCICFLLLDLTNSHCKCFSLLAIGIVFIYDEVTVSKLCTGRNISRRRCWWKWEVGQQWPSTCNLNQNFQATDLPPLSLPHNQPSCQISLE